MTDPLKLAVDLRPTLLHLIEVSGQLSTGNDILTLGVREEVSHQPVGPGGRVPCERHPGTGRLAHVAKHHRLDGGGGGDRCVDAFDLPVAHRPRRVPACENGLHRLLDLGQRIRWHLEALRRQRCDQLGRGRCLGTPVKDGTVCAKDNLGIAK